MKVLLDTNVILDHILSYEPHAEAIGKVFDLICRDEIDAVITANSVTDIYYIIAKRLGDVPARDALRDLFIVLGITGVDGADCISALDSPISDFEDAVVAVCAKRDIVDYIVTNDQKFLQVDPNLTSVITPIDLLKLV